MEEQRRRIDVGDGVSISYVAIEGAEPAVVLLHGLAGSANELLPTARELEGRAVLLVDQRGHGHSTRVPADVTRSAFIDDVIRVITTEATAPVDLVGQSMGAHTAMLVAAARPDLVRRLVLLECDVGSGSPDDHEALGDFFRSWKVPFTTREHAEQALGGGALARAWAADLEPTDDGLVPRFDPDVMVAIMVDVAVPRWQEWQSVTAPTLVVYADGGMFDDEQKAAFAAQGSDVTRADLPNASHDAHLDAHDAWVRVLQQHIALD